MPWSTERTSIQFCSGETSSAVLCQDWGTINWERNWQAGTHLDQGGKDSKWPGNQVLLRELDMISLRKKWLWNNMNLFKNLKRSLILYIPICISFSLLWVVFTPTTCVFYALIKSLTMSSIQNMLQALHMIFPTKKEHFTDILIETSLYYVLTDSN